MAPAASVHYCDPDKVPDYKPRRQGPVRRKTFYQKMFERHQPSVWPPFAELLEPGPLVVVDPREDLTHLGNWPQPETIWELLPGKPPMLPRSVAKLKKQSMAVEESIERRSPVLDVKSALQKWVKNENYINNMMKKDAVRILHAPIDKRPHNPAWFIDFNDILIVKEEPKVVKVEKVQRVTHKPPKAPRKSSKVVSGVVPTPPKVARPSTVQGYGLPPTSVKVVRPATVVGCGRIPTPPKVVRPATVVGYGRIPTPPKVARPSNFQGYGLPPTPPKVARPSNVQGYGLPPTPPKVARPSNVQGYGLPPTPPKVARPSKVQGSGLSPSPPKVPRPTAGLSNELKKKRCRIAKAGKEEAVKNAPCKAKVEAYDRFYMYRSN